MTKKILVVDDELSIREALDKMLREEGYDVVSAQDGREADEKLRAEKVDLLVLDIGLPVRDGWDTLRQLAKASSSLPVILITGRWKQAEQAAAAAVDVLMEKPLDVPRLLQVIRELLAEAPEKRCQRLRDRGRGFRLVPCDVDEFCEHLRQAYSTPFPCGEDLHHPK